MANITFLGTGLLGSAFAEAAAKRGDTVSAWNRSPDKLQALIPFGIKAAATPPDAVRGATRVHLILKDDAAIEAVIAAARCVADFCRACEDGGESVSCFRTGGNEFALIRPEPRA